MASMTKKRIGAVVLSGGLAAGSLGVGLVFPASSAAAATTTASATAAPGAAVPAWPVLRQGSNSAWPKVTVRSLQYLLSARGAKLPVDGVFGAKTKAAVVLFQRAHHLTADGVVGGATWSALIVAVKFGNAGPAVRAVQDQANFRNGKSGFTLGIDGVYGQLTAVWVAAFQYILGLNPDGVVGPLTWRALVTESLAG
jgi:murein L,D-transpeptidase YcbB/YkuD